MAGGRVYAGKNAERDKRNGIAGMGAGIIRVELRVFSFPSCSLQPYRQIQTLHGEWSTQLLGSGLDLLPNRCMQFQVLESLFIVDCELCKVK